MRNTEGKIATHYWEHIAHPVFGTASDFYTLMRETLELGETIEEALARGLTEEFGAMATLSRYLGPIVCTFPKYNTSIEKTTLYFLCDLNSVDESKREKEDEGKSEIRWIKPETLIPLMQAQGKRLEREDLDESLILQRI